MKCWGNPEDPSTPDALGGLFLGHVCTLGPDSHTAGTRREAGFPGVGVSAGATRATGVQGRPPRTKWAPFRPRRCGLIEECGSGGWPRCRGARAPGGLSLGCCHACADCAGLDPPLTQNTFCPLQLCGRFPASTPRDPPVSEDAQPPNAPPLCVPARFLPGVKPPAALPDSWGWMEN